MAHELNNYNILVADADKEMGKVLKSTLGQMGFYNVSLTESGKDALDLLKKKSYDFLITEWNVKDFDGIELLTRLRRDVQSPDLTLPVMMFSGRAEEQDIVTARDYGINEYVMKPFTAKAIYARLQRLIEMPRNFVLSQYFVGPDRRNTKGLPPQGVNDRRVTRIPALRKPSPAMAKTIAAEPGIKIWVADDALKRKLGMASSLSSLITTVMIEQAQTSIESSTQESVDWLKENLSQLKQLQQKMTSGDLYTMLPIDMSENALTLSARAGTFGYKSLSQIAYLLYLFCRVHMHPAEQNHQMIAQQHIAALQAMLAQPKPDANSDQDNEIVRELRNLADKYSS